MKHLTNRVQADLGVPETTAIVADLYKMLLYQQGDHFAPHQDTEKAPGMFATMTLLLPSQHEVKTHSKLCLFTCSCSRQLLTCSFIHRRVGSLWWSIAAKSRNLTLDQPRGTLCVVQLFTQVCTECHCRISLL